MADDIQAGRLGAGAWLKQIDLEQAYGFGRSDVRKALDELVARRLAEHVPNRGYRIPAFDPQRIIDMAEFRAVLEGAIADLIFDRADADELAQLDALAGRFEVEARERTLLEQNATNKQFHRRLIALCPNPELRQAAVELRDRSPSSLLYQRRTEGWVEQSIRDHHEIVDALRARDQAWLRRVMVSHIRLHRRAALADDPEVSSPMTR